MSSIRIRRRTAGQPGPPDWLAGGELAFNETDGTLYYGWGIGADGRSATQIFPIAKIGGYGSGGGDGGGDGGSSGSLSLWDGGLSIWDGGASVWDVVGGGSGTPPALKPLILYATGSYVPGSGGDDTPALEAAMAAGGQVQLPTGTLRQARSITAPAGCFIVGSGTTIVPTASMTTMLVCTGHGTIRDVTLANASGFATNGFACTKPKNDQRLTYADCEVTGFAGSGWLVTDGDVIRWLNPRADSCGTAILLQNGGMNSTVVNPHFVVGNGIDIGPHTTVQCEGFQVFGGTIMPATAGDFCFRLRSGLSIAFLGTIFDQVRKAGAHAGVIDSTAWEIRHITLDGCWFGRNAGTGLGTLSLLKMGFGDTEDINIVNCEFQDAGTYAIETVGPGLTRGLNVSGCGFWGSTTGDVSLGYCRATFNACHFTHATTPIDTTSPGGQASFSHVGCTFDGGSPHAPSLPIGVLPYISLSPGQTIYLPNPLVVTAGGASITGNVGITGTVAAANFGNGGGDPNGAIPATPGTLYARVHASTDLTDHELWVKSSGTDVTGWSAVASQPFVTRNLALSLPVLPLGALYAGTNVAGSATQATPSLPLSLTGGNLAVAAATNASKGVVQPDGTTITVTPDGVISAVSPVTLQTVTSGATAGSPAAIVSTGDVLCLVNKTAGAPSYLTLPSSPGTGARCTVKDGRNDAAANPITIIPAAGTIDGASDYVIAADRGVARFIYSGAEWSVA